MTDREAPRGAGPIRLRAVADALAWFGSASIDQIAAELGVSLAERPALEAALRFWVDRGEATVGDRTERGSVACARGCGGCGAHPAAGQTGLRVWSWVGPSRS